MAKAPAHSCPHVWGRWEPVTSKLEQRQCALCNATEMRTKQ
jgi:hypothetical protein